MAGSPRETSTVHQSKTVQMLVCMRTFCNKTLLKAKVSEAGKMLFMVVDSLSWSFLSVDLEQI